MTVRLFRVRGRSMLPTLADGDFIVAWRLSTKSRAKLRCGQIVCIQHPQFGGLIKRLTEIDNTSCRVGSDGQIGSESSTLGTLSLDAITHRGWLAITRTGIRRLARHPADLSPRAANSRK